MDSDRRSLRSRLKAGVAVVILGLAFGLAVGAPWLLTSAPPPPEAVIAARLCCAGAAPAAAPVVAPGVALQPSR